MAISERKIGDWKSPVTAEQDRPNRSAADMKAVFDSNSNELRTALNGLVDDLCAPSATAQLGSAAIQGVQGDTLYDQLCGLKRYTDETVVRIGAGDMQRALYDPQGKETDVYSYADAAAAQAKAVALERAEPPLRFDSVSVSAQSWTEDSPYEDYPFCTTIELAGVDAGMIPEIVLPLTTAASGVIAPVADSVSGGVVLYASETPEDFTISCALFWKV